ncbi:hypothetical protein JHK82_042474 [Glycine max]|uniref:Uncharacterized protein n=1 Tax=Glycine max TaxID=3847 RepID=A0A0R0GBD6_SOYBN|nr:hypothetical protein JHK86_042508 [Glycine max]KAG4956761.1 hypothetical protein JHK85_043141 [Glycine max]KAG5105504.1 hypothetical protein JHK82_042474 [Glycine max]KAH1147392.1 hypothetical protein GYH30_042520 [Glycine max]KRH12213.1 hypothetical protein GLYMA_15G159600v4 [Glycine max]
MIAHAIIWATQTNVLPKMVRALALPKMVKSTKLREYEMKNRFIHRGNLCAYWKKFHKKIYYWLKIECLFPTCLDYCSV